MNLGQTAKTIIAAIAPTIGTALAGPFGALAGTMLSKALNPAGQSGAAMTDKDVEAAVLSQSPDALAKIKQAELDFQAKLADLGVREEQLRFEDTDSARKREELVHDRTPKILAYGVTLGFFGILTWLLVNGKPSTGGDVVLVMLGALASAWSGIVAYYFGSSAGSAAKSDTIGKIAASSAANVAAASH